MPSIEIESPASFGPRPTVSVIVPARNEEVSLADCLQSLVSQSGVAFEIIVVDDHSTDRTPEIASSFPKVQVIEADPLPANWTGKNNAVAAGARVACGEWLLFTDADTIHLPGSLAAALDEAEANQAELLSYSPEQIAVTFWEMAVLPVVFAELARQYSPSKVSDPTSPVAAANGQYILIRRETYDAVGGHAPLATEILEDVALARAVKSSGRKILFRYAADRVRARMYRNFAQLREGWTKNLALLFPNPIGLSARLFFLWAVPIAAFFGNRWWCIPIYIGGLSYLFLRIKRSNFLTSMTIWATCFGPPMFAYLLLRSKRAHSNGNVAWKGRTYGSGATPTKTSPTKPSPTMRSLMRLTLLAVPTLLLLASSSPAASPRATRATEASQQPDTFSLTIETLIEPGSRIGPIKLGDSRERALQLFPKKDEDQQWDDRCGTTLDWVDSGNRAGRGDLFIRLNKKGKVIQIESSTTRFHTAEDITTFDHADKVASAYKNLSAYTLLTSPVAALGDRPLVFWIDKKKGIAFVFAFYPREHKRYVYKIIVFEPNKNFCPEEEMIDSPKWQALSPYTLEPPPELAPNLQ